MTNTLFQIALTRIPKVGPVTAKNLISYCGSPEAVFRQRKAALLKIPGVGEEIASRVLHAREIFSEAEQILEQCSRKQVRILFYLDKGFPRRLHHIPDSPLVLYVKGTPDLNHPRMLAMVGTRSPSSFGREMTEKLIKDLSTYNVLIISGLAYGIDIAAHQYCLRSGVPTIGILGSGFGRIYPFAHRHVAQRMIESEGGLVTEFEYATGPDRENFPMRNRLIAGLSDAVIIVESARKGGSMITANMANDYNKDVFAVPGRPVDAKSQGCNALIRENRAHLAGDGMDIARLLRWKEPDELTAIQRQIFVELDEDEKLIAEMVKAHREPEIDFLLHLSKMQMSKLATVLLSLEFKGVVKSLPGKKYKYLHQ